MVEGEVGGGGRGGRKGGSSACKKAEKSCAPQPKGGDRTGPDVLRVAAARHFTSVGLKAPSILPASPALHTLARPLPYDHLAACVVVNTAEHILVRRRKLQGC